MTATPIRSAAQPAAVLAWVTLLLLPATLPCWPAAAADAPALPAGTRPASRPSSPATAPADPAALVLQHILDTAVPRLSTGNDSAADRFACTVLLVSASEPARDGQAITILVARDGPRAALLVRHGKDPAAGPVIGYATAGLCVAVDPAHPGGLLVSTDGNPRFTLNATTEGPPSFELDACFRRASLQSQPFVSIDARSVLAGAVRHAVRPPTFDAATATFAVHTPSAEFTVQPSDPRTHAFALIGFAAKYRAGSGLAVAFTTGDNARVPPALFRVTLADVKKLGTPIRTVGPDERQMLVPSPDKAADAEVSKAAAALGSLFVGRTDGRAE